MEAGKNKSKIGSGVRNPALRITGNPDPIHGGIYIPLGPVRGKGGTNICGPYEPVLGWPAPIHPGEWRSGSGRGVYAESPDRVVVVFGGEVPAYDHKSVWGVETFRDLRFTEINAKHEPRHRRCHEVVVFDRQGKLIDSWDQWLDALVENDIREGIKPKSGHVNRIRVDRHDAKRHIWLVGGGNTGVFKFTNDGKELVLKIDARDVPEEYHPFYYPQDIAFLPDGDFYIGHQHHLMRFSPEGKFLYALGGQGQGPLQFDGIHGIEVHPHTLNLIINDRVNRRMQILDKDGKYLDEWPGFQGVYAIRLTADGRYMWVGNGFVHKFLKYDMNGRLVPEATWGTFGIAPGAIWGPHYFDTDVEGSLYVTEDYSGRVQKFRPLDGANPADPQLIGQLCR